MTVELTITLLPHLLRLSRDERRAQGIDVLAFVRETDPDATLLGGSPACSIHVAIDADKREALEAVLADRCTVSPLTSLSPI